MKIMICPRSGDCPMPCDHGKPHEFREKGDGLNNMWEPGCLDTDGCGRFKDKNPACVEIKTFATVKEIPS
jgi:hypothetical protein